jgi:hypothetical protein
MKTSTIMAFAACTLALGAATSAHAVPFVLSDDQAGAVCDESMAGADVYLFVGTWPNSIAYRYVCNGYHWEIDR